MKPLSKELNRRSAPDEFRRRPCRCELPETFPRFRREAWLPGGKHVGWNIEDGIRARGHVSESDLALEGVYHPENEETPLCESPPGEKAA